MQNLLKPHQDVLDGEDEICNEKYISRFANSQFMPLSNSTCLNKGSLYDS